MEFTNLDDFFNQESEARTVADTQVRPEHVVEPGEFFVREAYGLHIYSEVLDAAAYMLDGRTESDLDEEEREEIESVRESYADPSMKYYAFTKSYSQVCPRGELGDVHMSCVSRKITRSEFESARASGWI